MSRLHFNRMTLWNWIQSGVARSWAREEMAPWTGRGFSSSLIQDAVDKAVQRHEPVLRFDIAERGASFKDKDLSGFGGSQKDNVTKRACAFRDLLTRAARSIILDDPLTLAINLGDVPPFDDALPIFCFQKPTGSSCVLLPDVDLLALNFLTGPEFDDDEPFSRKADHAIFAGSTTGGDTTLESAKALSLPRLRAAMFFKHQPHVTFALPSIVQVADAQTHDYLVSLDLGDERIEWKDQIPCKYLISIDGNGATCSRVAAALKSNSVLLKYDSPYQLFYFRGLKPWKHFVPIHDDQGVLDVVRSDPQEMRTFAAIARRGKRFYETYLNEDFSDRYVAELLKAYSEVMRPSAS